MIAEELMIGDWVVGNSEKPFQLGEIDPNFMYWDEVKPIPLTQEILEKNGFEKFPFHHIKNQHVWSFHQDMRIFVDLSTRKLNDNPVNGWSISISSTCTSEMIHKIDYVHELQHALKFSKIDKKIEL